MPDTLITTRTAAQNISANGSHPGAPEYHEEDMIDLVDVAVGIYRHRLLFLGVWATVVAIGVLYAFLRSPDYEFATTIEIGTRVVANRILPLENGADVVVKLKKSYIPAAVAAAARESTVNAFRPLIKVENARNSNLVLLRTTAPAEYGAQIIRLQEKIVNDLVNDHERQVAVTRASLLQKLHDAELQLDALKDPSNLDVALKPLQRQLVKAQARLAELQDQDARGAALAKLEAALQTVQNKRLRLDDDIERYRARLERLDGRKKQLEDQLEQVAAQLAEAQSLRQRAVMQASDSSEAMTLMLIDGQIQRREDLNTRLQKELTIDLPNQEAELNAALQDAQRQVAVADKEVQQAQVAFDRFPADWDSMTRQQKSLVENLTDRLTKTKNDNQRDIEKSLALIEKIKSDINNVRATHGVLDPQQSQKPVGASAPLIIVVALFLGAVLGLLTVGLAAFREKLHARLIAY